MMDREKVKHIDAFKYWCETNEENGVITIPKFLCEHIIEILDDTNARPHGEWIESKERKGHFYCSECVHQDVSGKWRELFDFKYNFCPNCGLPMNEKAIEILRKREGEEE